MDDLKTGLKYLDAHYHLIPAPAHLSACVESIKAVQPNHHHDVIKENIRKRGPRVHHLNLSLKEKIYFMFVYETWCCVRSFINNESLLHFIIFPFHPVHIYAPSKHSNITSMFFSKLEKSSRQPPVSKLHQDPLDVNTTISLNHHMWKVWIRCLHYNIVWLFAF